MFIYCYLCYILICNYILYIKSLSVNMYIEINRYIDIDKAVFLKVYFTNLYPQLWIHILEVF